MSTYLGSPCTHPNIQNRTGKLDNSSRTDWTGCRFDLAAVTCALEKLEMIDSDMNPDVAGITNLNEEICNAWRLAAMVGMVPRQCLNVGLQVRSQNLPRRVEIFDMST